MLSVSLTQKVSPFQISVGGVLASDDPTPEEMASFLNATVQGVAAAELAGIAKSNMIVVR